MIFESDSDEMTYDFARSLGEKAEAGQVYALNGELGAGKTVFAKGFAEGLGVTERVNSPTYTILHSYLSGRLPFHHFDVYRIAEPEEMEETGYEDCFYAGGVSLVEWAEQIREILPENTIFVNISKAPEKGAGYRRIEIDDLGD
ncbi:MAG: tRNA (adenosine(37)-N6)-threonylcarbamoyltransferase complex ATPase subunit type 1 TsaE [Lachnospiraceae bacterium]|nr:tRNA (adenosine(37)-N6)-threonylcarbamoyltransferase complex ATPase subunit type 1 TsaE [Lachnospiraceae bacterium]